jgi:hypothetical protein
MMQHERGDTNAGTAATLLNPAHREHGVARAQLMGSASIGCLRPPSSTHRYIWTHGPTGRTMRVEAHRSPICAFITALSERRVSGNLGTLFQLLVVSRLLQPSQAGSHGILVPRA